MLPRQTIFHLAVLVGSIFSTFPRVISSPSNAHRWKALPAKGSKPPESNVMATEDDVKPSPLIGQHDAVTSESEHVTDDVTTADDNKDKAENLVKGEVRGESKSRKAGEDELIWGKTGKRKWGQNSLSVWGKREHNEGERRAWGDRNLNAWGKRPGGDDERQEAGEKRKWGENAMSVWGKRSEEADDDDEDVGKRKWGENTMGVWGKRRSHKEEEEEEENIPSADENPGNLASGHKSDVTHATTGPRTLRKRSVFDHDPNPDPAGTWYGRFDPSQWTPPSRRAYPNPRPNDGPKRKWETNTMKVWGKRNAGEPASWKEYPFDVEPEPPVDGKRQWSSNSAIRIWGKRKYNAYDN